LATTLYKVLCAALLLTGIITITSSAMGSSHIDDEMDKGSMNGPSASDVGVDIAVYKQQQPAVVESTAPTSGGTSGVNTHIHRLLSFLGILRMSECALSLIGFTCMCGAGSDLTVALAYTMGANIIVFTYTSILVLLYVLQRIQGRIYKLPIYELCSNIICFLLIFIAAIVGPIACSNVCSSQYTSGQRSAIEASIVFTWLTGCVLVLSTLKIMLERSVKIELAIRDK